MQATLGSNPSYIWRSLLWSMELLNKGIQWRVGNGRHIKTFIDNWIPGIKANIGHVNHNFDTVDTLIQCQSWKIDIVQSIFPPYIAQEVLNIPLSPNQQPDSRFWKYDPKGKYLVRDGYKLDIGFFDPPSYCSELK